MSAKVMHGQVTVTHQGSAEFFVGATGPGEFPEPGVKYQQYSFTPEPGSSGLIISKFEVGGLEPTYSIHQYFWKDGKLRFEWRIESWTHAFSQAKEYGYFVKVGDVLYCTKRPAHSRYTCKQVDIVNLFKYVDGVIDLTMLEKKAYLVELRERHQRRTDAEMRELGNQVLQLQAHLRRQEITNMLLDHRRAEMQRTATDYMLDATDLRSLVLKMPKWFWHLFTRKNKNLQQRLELVYAHIAPDA